MGHKQKTDSEANAEIQAGLMWLANISSICIRMYFLLVPHVVFCCFCPILYFLLLAHIFISSRVFYQLLCSYTCRCNCISDMWISIALSLFSSRSLYISAPFYCMVVYVMCCCFGCGSSRSLMDSPFLCNYMILYMHFALIRLNGLPDLIPKQKNQTVEAISGVVFDIFVQRLRRIR